MRGFLHCGTTITLQVLQRVSILEAHLPEAPFFNLHKDVQAVNICSIFFKFSGQHSRHAALNMYLSD